MLLICFISPALPSLKRFRHWLRHHNRISFRRRIVLSNPRPSFIALFFSYYLSSRKFLHLLIHFNFFVPFFVAFSNLSSARSNKILHKTTASKSTYISNLITWRRRALRLWAQQALLAEAWLIQNAIKAMLMAVSRTVDMAALSLSWDHC